MALLQLVAFVTIVSAALGADCQWDKDVDYPELYPPLLLDEASWTSVLPVLEGGKRIVTVPQGASLLLVCPETVVTALQLEVAEVTCVGGTTLLVDGQEFALSDLGCASNPKESLQKNLGDCGVGGVEQSIGFTVTGFGFYELIRVCFDPVYETTLYSRHTVRGLHVSAKDASSDRPSFKADTGFFTVSADTCYQQSSQITLMEKLLGDSSVINVDESLYFARGHMSPDADFVTTQEQDSTYYYINAAPQWQSFNNGNWKNLEGDSRDLASARAADLQVWSGGWRVLQLPDLNNNPVDIFLGLTEDQTVIPAPDITWKVVYDPVMNEGAAVVGVNNPYLTEFPTPVCGSESLCQQLTWLTLNTGDFRAGATYCCTVQDLRSAIPNAPDLGSATLLTA